MEPTRSSLWCVIGAIAGALSVVPLAPGAGASVLAIVAIIAIVTAGYLAARSASGAVSEVFRGFLIGFNAGWTVVLAAAIGRLVLPIGEAFAIGGVLGAIVLASAQATISRRRAYQGLLGWSSWLMPPTWIVNALGLGFLVLSVLGAVVTLGRLAPLAITGIAVDGPTGTIFLKGGWIANLNQEQTAFDMGHFGFVHKDSTSYYMAHETGHTLSLGAFGSVFHLVGFVDEMSPAGDAAYSERLAEGHDPSGTGPKLPMWSPSAPPDRLIADPS
ncbi:MAG TPA: hypothetical protein VH165_07600 [Kofleriaceae bacterium]|nr:hypothetical protein [Kofleriaceae bacterium]